MKRIICILCTCLLLTLCACTPESSTDTPIYEPQESEPVTQTKYDGPYPAYEIHTNYYTVPIPQEWADICAYDISQMDNGLDILSLYEVTAYDAFGGGKLCSIQLMSTDDDTYKDFPDYEWLGALDTPEGSFNLILRYPTDVQFTEETMDTYNKMSQQLQDVICTIYPKEGIEMVMPAPVL